MINTKMPNSALYLARPRWVSNVMWFGFLLLLLIISFNSLRYDNASWLLISSVTYLYTCIFVLAASLGMRLNFRALKASKLFLVFAVLALIWQYLQTILPHNHDLLSTAFTPETPLWFLPNSTISIDVSKTRWLLLSNLFVLQIFILCLLQVSDRARVRQLLILLLVVAVLHVVSGLSAYIAKVQLVDKELVDGHFSVARGWFVNRNHFGSLLALVLAGPVGIALLMRVKKGRNQTSRLASMGMTSSVVIIVLVLVALLLSQSRAALGSVLVMGALCVGLALVHKVAHVRSLKFLAITAVVVSAVLLFSFGDGLLHRLQNGALSIGERLTQWQITWAAISESLLVGYGGGSYGTVFQAFRDHAELRQVIYNQSHNEYLHVWLEQGLIGLSLWLAIIVLSVKRALNNLQHSKSSLVRIVTLCCLMSIGAVLLQAGVDFNLQIINIRSYFFVIIALLFALPSIKHNLIHHHSPS